MDGIDMSNRNIRQGYEHWCLTAMYLIGIYLIGTQRAAPCQTSLAPENSTACRSRPWRGSSSAASSGWCLPKAVAAALTRSRPIRTAALHLSRPRNTRRQVQAHLRSRVRHAARERRRWRHRHQRVHANAAASRGRPTRRTGGPTMLPRRMRKRSSRSC